MPKNPRKKFALPVVLLGIILSIYLSWTVLNLSPDGEFMRVVRNYFETYGLITVLVSAIIEGLFLLGWYYPGSLVIFFGVVFAGKDLTRIAEVIFFVTLGLLTAYVVNFFLGKHGWYRLLLAFGFEEPLRKAQGRLTRHGAKMVLVSCCQPNLAALISTSAGILRISFKKFLIYSLIATAFWSVFWGLLVYFLGEASFSFFGVRYAIMAIGAWIIFRLLLKKDPEEAKELVA